MGDSLASKRLQLIDAIRQLAYIELLVRIGQGLQLLSLYGFHNDIFRIQRLLLCRHIKPLSVGFYNVCGNPMPYRRVGELSWGTFLTIAVYCAYCIILAGLYLQLLGSDADSHKVLWSGSINRVIAGSIYII